MFEWILRVIEQAGYLGVFALMLLENLFPPIPSEMIMPLVGFQAASGLMNPYLAVAMGVLGSVAGALPWYAAGRIFGKHRLEAMADRFGLWLGLDGEDIRRAERWFMRYGWAATLFGRVIPLIRTLISVPAGLARMPLAPFLALTTLGSLAWVGALTAAGYLLKDQYVKVEAWVDPLSKLVLVAIVLTYLVRVGLGLRARAKA